MADGETDTAGRAHGGPWWRLLRHAHPLAVAVAPVLTLYSVNHAELSPAQALRPALFALAAAVLLWGPAYLLARRDACRAAILLSLFLFAVPLYGPFLALAAGVAGGLTDLYPDAKGARFNPDAVALPLWALACAAVLAVARGGARRGAPCGDACVQAWLCAVSLIVPPLFRLLPPLPSIRRPAATAASPVNGTPPLPAPGALPDLYVIVLDAHGRQDVLQERYGVDAEPFLAALEARGFRVARRSRANYMQTSLAIPAALNLDYLPHLHGGTAPGEPAGDGCAARTEWTDRNRLAALLRARGGFKFVSIPTGYAPTATPSADLLLDGAAGGGDGSGAGFTAAYQAAVGTPYATEFEDLLIRQTPLSALFRRHDPFRAGGRKVAGRRALLLGAFSRVGEAAALTYPKFVFAHIVAPHPPFVFTADGGMPAADQPTSEGDATDYAGSPDAYREGYAGQVRFIDRQALWAVDAILKSGKRPSVIVLMSDHGPRSGTDWHSAEKTDTHELMSNLLAVYAPDPASGVPGAAKVENLRAGLDGVITPVNALRLVADAYYGADLPRLPDRSYYSTTSAPCTFVDVTPSLDARDAAPPVTRPGG